MIRLLAVAAVLTIFAAIVIMIMFESTLAAFVWVTLTAILIKKTL